MRATKRPVVLEFRAGLSGACVPDSCHCLLAIHTSQLRHTGKGNTAKSGHFSSSILAGIQCNPSGSASAKAVSHEVRAIVRRVLVGFLIHCFSRPPTGSRRDFFPSSWGESLGAIQFLPDNQLG